ncbi:AAA family ATPase [Streptomyces sp. NPDC004134]|uniref:AAA family ATPase n=1 Tax=Streptomyces sp. NPDC004134 TaxID=3364691 RepID=UPI0036A6E7FA
MLWEGVALENLGIDRLDPALLAAADGLAGAVAAAVETGAARVEPSHLVIALARMPGSEAARLFDRSGIPVEAFVEALRAKSPPRTGLPPMALTAATAAPATRELLAALPAGAGERQLLAAALSGLEPAAAELLVEYGRVDLDRAIAGLRAEPAAPREVFGDDGRLLPDRFSPGARRVLAVLAELAAQGSGAEAAPLPTTLLLQAMAAVPNGLVEQGCAFLGHDVRALRTQLVSLTGNGAGPSGVPGPAGARPALSRDGVHEPLARTLEKAAAVAAQRRGEPVAERDLLAALLDTPVGLAAGFLRGTRIDLTRLRRFADTLYQEHVPQESEGDSRADMPPLHESLAWMHERLVGRESVIERLTPSLEMITRSLRRGLRLQDRPLARFLFCGRSGTGKTLAARVLAKVVYGSEDDVLFFEMGQFNTKESMNNFIGAAPGYVGFGEGKLTNGLRDNPRRVLLFDEVEKADGRVLDALLRLLDEGQISDPAGPVRDARDSVIVLTSNLGTTGPAGGPGPYGAGEDPDDAAHMRRIMEGFFRPEFLNRIDEVILFEAFRQDQLEAIALGGLRRQAAQVGTQLGVELYWQQDVPARIAELAVTRRGQEAARGVNRYIDGVFPPLLRLLDEADARGESVERARIVVDGERLSVVNAGG